MTLINETGVDKYVLDSQGELIEHFLGGNYNASLSPVGVLGLTSNVSGAGAGISVSSFSNRIGVISLNTGTTATGFTNLFNLPGLIFNSSNLYLKYEVCVLVSNLSVTGQVFMSDLGFVNAATSYTQFCKFNISGSSLTGGVSNGTTSSNTNSFTIVANTWYILKILFTPTTANFFVNNSPIGSLTVGLPIDGSGLGSIINIIKSTGTTSRRILIDYLKLGWRL